MDLSTPAIKSSTPFKTYWSEALLLDLTEDGAIYRFTQDVDVVYRHTQDSWGKDNKRTGFKKTEDGDVVFKFLKIGGSMETIGREFQRWEMQEKNRTYG